jgi:hypothetical protein
LTSLDVKLMTKDQYLGFQRGPRPEQSDQRQPEQAASFSHKAEALCDSASVATRIRFPTATGRFGGLDARAARQAVARQRRDVAKAMDYMLKRWIAFTRFLEDGRVCLSNNAAERGVRGIALGRKSWLFCGSDRGGERAAIMYSLIVTVIPVLPSMHAIEAPRPVRR